MTVEDGDKIPPVYVALLTFFSNSSPESSEIILSKAPEVAEIGLDLEATGVTVGEAESTIKSFECFSETSIKP